MAVHNIEIANLFNELADLLEIEGANPFRVRAYRTAARVIASTSKEFSEMVREGKDLTEIPGIGDHIAEKIQIIVKTGALPQLKEVQKRTPQILSHLMKIEGLGPKRVKILYDKLRLRNVGDLQKAIADGKVQALRGFGEKTEALIKAGLAHLGERLQRYLYADAAPIAQSLENYLKKSPQVKMVVIAGSYRRRRDTVGDLDVLVLAQQGVKVINYFTRYDEVADIMAKGTTRATVRLRSGIQVDLRVLPQLSYGAALIYFTGSKSHNIILRAIAIKLGYKVNEYGMFKGKRRVAGKTEAEMYKKLGLAYIEPELREDRGEIAAAKAGKLPKLITLEDIRGDLHCHTSATDGADDLETMVRAAAKKGLEYIAITDHTKHLAMVHGFDKKALFLQIKAIDRLNAKLKNIVILKSIEVDILEDGKLDLPDEVLKELDLTICAIHSNFNLSSSKQTSRLLKAMDNPYFNIMAHPTGRLLGKREPYAMDLEKIMYAAKERNCILEINAQPERLDLNDIHCQMAKSMGVKLVIATDAHSPQQLDHMQFGVFQARRGWLTAEDVLNTRPLQEFMKLIKRR